MRILVTGGAGFIGSHVTAFLVERGHEVSVCDKFTYAGMGKNLQGVWPHIRLVVGDLACGDTAARCAAAEPQWVLHLAANTHVDRAIRDPESFMQANVVGTTRLLRALTTVSPERIVVYSTDEVFGPLLGGHPYQETQPYNPSNAYSASKVGVEAVTRAFWTTHHLPVVLIRSCNTYGPRQHPEKVIPRFVRQSLRGKPMTIYNDGLGSRDWLHVQDHCRAVLHVAQHGVPGESYNFAAGCVRTDAEIAAGVRAVMEKRLHIALPEPILVPGRPGHDARYQLDARKVQALGWKPSIDFCVGFHDTIVWCLDNPTWWE